MRTPQSLLGQELIFWDWSIVADITVMLALMAGRNAKDTMTLVNEGRVRTSSCIPRPYLNPDVLPAVADSKLGTFWLLRAPTELKLGLASAHCRLHRLRAHRTSDSFTAGSLRLQDVPLRDACGREVRS